MAHKTGERNKKVAINGNPTEREIRKKKSGIKWHQHNTQIRREKNKKKKVAYVNHTHVNDIQIRREK